MKQMVATSVPSVRLVALALGCFMCAGVFAIGQASGQTSATPAAGGSQRSGPPPLSTSASASPVQPGTAVLSFPPPGGAIQGTPYSASSTQVLPQPKDVSDSSDKTINRIAQMYEKFATLITFFITALGVCITAVASVFAFFAFKSLGDFKKLMQTAIAKAEGELNEELQKLKDLAAREVGQALVRVHEPEMKAQEAARRAEAFAAELQNRQEILNNYLQTADTLKAEVAALRDIMLAHGLEIPVPPEAVPTAPIPAVQEADTREAEAIKAKVEEKIKPEGNA